jgi:hypothetical protein
MKISKLQSSLIKKVYKLDHIWAIKKGQNNLGGKNSDSVVVFYSLVKERNDA